MAKDKLKMKWYMLIAIALLLGAMIGYFATEKFTATGKATAAINAENELTNIIGNKMIFQYNEKGQIAEINDVGVTSIGGEIVPLKGQKVVLIVYIDERTGKKGVYTVPVKGDDDEIVDIWTIVIHPDGTSDFIKLSDVE